MACIQWLRAAGALGGLVCLTVSACGGRDSLEFDELDDLDTGEAGARDSATGRDGASGRDGAAGRGGASGTGGTGGAGGGATRDGATVMDRVMRDVPFVCPTTSSQLGNLNRDPCSNAGQVCAACRGNRGGYRSCTCTAARWACSDSDDAHPTLGCPSRPGGTGGGRGDSGSPPRIDSGTGPRRDSGADVRRDARSDSADAAVDAREDRGGDGPTPEAAPDGEADAPPATDASLDGLLDGFSSDGDNADAVQGDAAGGDSG